MAVTKWQLWSALNKRDVERLRAEEVDARHARDARLRALDEAYAKAGWDSDTRIIDLGDGRTVEVRGQHRMAPGSKASRISNGDDRPVHLRGYPQQFDDEISQRDRARALNTARRRKFQKKQRKAGK